MGSLLHVLGALFLVGLAESELPAASARPWAVALLLPLPHLLALAAARAGRAGRFRAAELLARLLEHAAPLCFALCVLACGWLATVRQRLGLAPGLLGWPGPGLLATLTPYVLLELLAIDARVRLRTGPGVARHHALAFERRMFAASAAPFALYVLFAAAIGASERVRVPLEEIGLFGTLFTVLSLGGFLVLLPAVLRRTWSTTPLAAGELRTMLEEVARRAGFRYGQLCVWHTGHRMANAAIVGLGPRQRFVLLSDALLAELTPREIAAVFAHEMGHALRHHAAFFLVTLASVFFGLQLALRGLPIEDPVWQLVALGLLIGLWALGFGYLSRRFELEADLESLAIVGDAAPLASALTHVGGAHAQARDSWRHFSTRRRIAFLEAVERDPRVGTGLRRRLRRARGAFVLGLVLVAGAEGFFLVGDLPRERSIAALRLGDWAAARAHLPDDAEQGLRLLVERAQGLDAELRDPTALEERARCSLASGDAEGARELLELAGLRGGEDLEPIARALDGLLRESAPGARPDGFAALPERWRSAFADHEREP